jgi:hypothetical protein
MVLIKKMFLFVMFLATISLSLAAEEPATASNPQTSRWPILDRFKAMNDPELDQWNSEQDGLTEVMPLPRVQEMIARFPLYAEGVYIELLLESFRLAQEAGSLDNVKKVLEFYHQGFREAYYKRFPQEEQKNFDVIMNPFQVYINSLREEKIQGLEEDKANDVFENAWKLLKQVLKTEKV